MEIKLTPSSQSQSVRDMAGSSSSSCSQLLLLVVVAAALSLAYRVKLRTASMTGGSGSTSATTSRPRTSPCSSTARGGWLPPARPRREGALLQVWRVQAARPVAPHGVALEERRHLHQAVNTLDVVISFLIWSCVCDDETRSYRWKHGSDV